MEFEIGKSNNAGTTVIRYYMNDGSFDCIPLINTDIDIAVVYLNIGIDSEDMCVKCLWGFSPKESWQEITLTAPSAEEGLLKLIGEYEAGLTVRLDKDKQWGAYYDKLSGWCCFGSSVLEKEDQAVKVMKNMVAVVDNMRALKAIWVKPEFV